MSGAPREPLTIRNTRREDFPAITALCRRVYPDIPPWRAEQLAAQHEVFPEGQFVAIADDDAVVGMAASLIVLWDDYDLQDSYRDLTAGGRFSNHDPDGRTLYGAEVMVDPDRRGLGIGRQLYAARRALVRELGLLRIRAGARLPGYRHHTELSPTDYVIEVIHGRLGDPTLSFQLREGFRVLAVVEDYIQDPQSGNAAAVIEWINDEVATPDDYRGQDPRFALPAGLWPAGV